jgi:hypothetical protein
MRRWWRLELVGELAAGVHLADDVAAADELPVDVELGDRRPARELLDALADAGSCSTLMVSKGTPWRLSTSTTAAEKPHCGKDLLPFMNSRTLWLATRWARYF